MTGEDRSQAVVVGALRCASCGYSLAGLPVGALCPECGERSEARAVRLLVQSDPAFVARQAHAMGLMMRALYLLALTGAATFALVLLSPFADARVPLLWVRAGALALTLWWWGAGVWSLLAPEGGCAAESSVAIERERLRRLSMLQVALMILLIITTHLGCLSLYPVDRSYVRNLSVVLSLPAQWLLVVVWQMMMHTVLDEVRDLARRVPDESTERLAKSCRPWLLVTGLVDVLMLLGPVLSPLLLVSVLTRVRASLAQVRYAQSGNGSREG